MQEMLSRMQAEMQHSRQPAAAPPKTTATLPANGRAQTNGAINGHASQSQTLKSQQVWDTTTKGQYTGTSGYSY